MKVRKSKKILKNLICPVDPNFKYYKSVVWDHKGQYFRALNRFGQMYIILL